MYRILVCSEFSKLNTGYAVYCRAILERLSKKFEVAELASYVSDDDPRINGMPWKVYGILPERGSAMEKAYNHNSDQFGRLIFDDVCLDFKPTHVLSIRDTWMDSHIAMSPARPYFRWIYMPPVDGFPQNEEWLSMFSTADIILTYQDWSKKVLEDTGIKVFASAPPVADEAFYPLGREERDNLRSEFGFKDKFVIGTVMRNQKRKLFPDLFEAFSKFSQLAPNAVLYCHTSYPDMGWNLPKYMNAYGISSKVYYTYVCGVENNGCGNVFPALFSDSLTVCPRCRRPIATVSSTHVGVSTETLSLIYNTFDLYIQYSNSEGFGMSQAEAAACGIPVAAIPYSAMADVVLKLKGFPLHMMTLYDELETGCKRAVPDNVKNSIFLYDYYKIPSEKRDLLRLQTRLAFEENYSSWDKTVGIWEKAILATPPLNRWNARPNYNSPNENIPKNCSNSEYARFLVREVLCDSSYENSYLEARLIRDLNYGSTAAGMSRIKFDRKMAWEYMASLCNKRNKWEKKRESIIHSSLQRR